MQWIYLVVVAALAFVAAAQKVEEDARVFRHPLTDMPPAAEDVESAHFFPEHPDHKFPIGEVVTALCHFSNEGSTYYNVSAIMGSLNSPFEFRHHFQNYSYKPFGTVVKPGEEITFNYNFQLHSELEPVDYQLAITVFYESDKQSFSTTFFNQVRVLQTMPTDIFMCSLSIRCVNFHIFADC
jgi:translocon-associated protein subunit alpha